MRNPIFFGFLENDQLRQEIATALSGLAMTFLAGYFLS